MSSLLKMIEQSVYFAYVLKEQVNYYLKFMPQIYFVLIFSKYLVAVKRSLSTRAVYLNPVPPTPMSFTPELIKCFQLQSSTHKKRHRHMKNVCADCVAETLYVTLH